MKNHKELLIDLEELSALMIDSVNGFEIAEEKTEHEPLKRFLSKSKLQSELIVNELNELIIKHEGEIKTKGTLKGAVNHLWMRLKSQLDLPDQKTFLESLETCEQFNLERYEHILKNRHPEHIESIFKRHHSTLVKRIKEIRSIKLDLGYQGA
jgi:uncharacterized protein (TIGR02284 family)